jgi:hypothetical protein
MEFNNLLNLINNNNLININEKNVYIHSTSLDLGIIPGINDDIKNILNNNFNITTTIQLYGQFMLLFENNIQSTTYNFYLWLHTHLQNIDHEYIIKITCYVKEKLQILLNMN